jgi:hypothetical protein
LVSQSDLGQILGHGEPESGMGQGEAADTGTGVPGTGTSASEAGPGAAGTASATVAHRDGAELAAMDLAQVGRDEPSGPAAA